MTVYETPVRVQVDPTPGDSTRVRLTLSAHDGECGMFEDVPVAWLRDQLGLSVPGPAGDVDLDAIKARYEAATDGPWETDTHGHLEDGCRCLSCYRGTSVTLTTNARFCEEQPTGDPQCPVQGYTWEDAEFIAHARTDVPALVAEVERLRAELDRQMPAALEAGEAIVDRAVNEAVAETEARMIARAEAAEAERDAAVTRAGTLAAQVDRVRALADEFEQAYALSQSVMPGDPGRMWPGRAIKTDVAAHRLRAALDGGGE